MRQPRRVSGRVYSKLLGGCATKKSLARLELVDQWADEAVSVLRNEEPSLLAWLEGNAEIEEALRTDVWAFSHIILHGLQGGADLEEIVLTIAELAKRSAAVLACYAVLQDRKGVGRGVVVKESERL